MDHMPAMTAGRSTFDKLVALRIGSEWIGVDTIGEARHLLLEDWPAGHGPSFARALAACDAVAAGQGAPIAARAAFTVAAMEAGLAFELFDDRLAFLDFQVAHATEEDVRSSRLD
jgi:hypothetical protein